MQLKLAKVVHVAQRFENLADKQRREVNFAVRFIAEPQMDYEVVEISSACDVKDHDVLLNQPIRAHKSSVAS